MQKRNPTDEAAPRLHSLDDALRILNIGRTTLSKLIGEGSLTLVKIGRRSLITDSSIDSYIEKLTQEH